MSQFNKIQLSVFQYEGSLEDYLKEILQCSRNLLKKSALTKKQLQLNLTHKKQIEVPIEVINHLMINPLYEGEENLFINETDEFLILSKPAGLHMHPHRYLDKDTLLNYLRQSSYHNYLKVNQSKWDRGLVYRLDYETSGLVLYAKNDQIYEKYRDNFHDLVESKVYYAICKGKVESTIFKDKVNYRGEKKGSGYVIGHGEYSAFIEVELCEFDEESNLSLVKVKLYEGIRHQIRIQLSHHKHPILGDELYKGPKSDRLYLHCYEYTINGKTYRDDKLKAFFKFFNLNC